MTADPATPTAERPSLWATLRAAVRGTDDDMTRVPLERAVILLAVPMVLEMSMESLLTVVDMLFVSRLGADAVATVGLTEAMLSIIYALAMGMSAAATAIIARKTGEKDSEGASNAAVQVIGLSVLLAAVVGGVGAIFAPRLLAAMGAEPSLVATGSSYTAVMLGGSVTIFLLFVINAAFRGTGDATISMRTLWISNLLNMALSPCLIFGLGPFPRMGVTGAAVATTVSRGVGVAFQVFMLLGGKRRLVVLARHVRVQLDVIREVFKVSVGASFQTLIETASWLGLVRILSLHGSDALAGYTFAIRIAIFVLLPCWGLGNAAATLVGQNLGAKQPERAKRAVNTIAKYNVAFLGVVSVVFVALAHPLIRLFTDVPVIEAYGVECLRIVALGFLFFGYGMVAIQAFNGAGKTSIPMVVNVICFWGVKIPLAYLLSEVVGLGPRGVFIAIAIAYSSQAVLAGVLFQRGRWAAPPSPPEPAPAPAAA
ncbi:MAG: MATE family efflux transporter [Polyangiaceae bacterium]